MISNPFGQAPNICSPIEFLGRSARRLLEFTLLLLVAAAACLLTGFIALVLLNAVAVDPARSQSPVLNLSLMCLQILAALWILSLIKRGYSLRTLFQIRWHATVGLAISATVLIVIAALLVDLEAICMNEWHPIKPNLHPEVWRTALATMALSAFFEELFHRALLQPLITRLFASEAAGLIGAAAIFTAMHAWKDAVLVFPGALLFGLVFLHTRSVVCTTALHLAMNVTLDLLKGQHLMVSPLLSAEEFAPMRPAIGLALLLLTIAFELLHRSADRRADQRADGRAMRTPPNERTAIDGGATTSV
ncbi:CPBP family intramembrane glutamic endopeptidase [Roseateles sp.]|uniref:CPBP family intramembrane glutamic endopeptidase n=1 Tax=Roseateles sp. TaxID=1971397 RepID=UPI002F413312